MRILPTNLCNHILFLFSHTASTYFQCNYSNVSGLYTPSIPDLYFNQDTSRMFRFGDSSILSATSDTKNYVYYTPASESDICNGTVTAVQICYQSKYQDYVNYTFGEFVLLSKNKTQFTPVKNFSLATHMNSNVCVSGKGNTKYICCENITLSSSNQFNISSLDYFGFSIHNTDIKIKPLRFNNRNFAQPYYQYSSFPSIMLNHRIPMGSLIILRFHISKLHFSTISTILVMNY